MEHCNYIRRQGVLQFIATYRRMEHLKNDPFFYGDELEYALLKLDGQKAGCLESASEMNPSGRFREVRLHLNGPEVMQRLQQLEQEGSLPQSKMFQHV